MDRVPVFVINGFLESGKTSFVRDAILRDPNLDEERFLILCCEEGIEEYDALPDNVIVKMLDAPEALTAENLALIDAQCAPTYVVIEYNGIWGMNRLYDLALPEGWELSRQFTMTDALTFKNYFTNMRSIFADMMRLSSRVYANHCTREDDFRFYRDSIKSCAPRTEIVYASDEEGYLEIMLEEDLPYDLDAEIIAITPDDFLIWYIDLLENQERYEGRAVWFVGQYTRPDYFREGYFLAGSTVMTCCEDDLQFLTLLCRSDAPVSFAEQDWMALTGVIRYEYAPEYGEEGPVIYLSAAEPTEEPVYEDDLDDTGDDYDPGDDHDTGADFDGETEEYESEEDLC